MLGMMRWFMLSFCAGLFIAGPARAFTYEVLFEDTIGRDAVMFGKQPGFVGMAKVILLDGKVKTSGTETTSYDRILMNYVKVMQQIAIGPNAALRGSLPILINYQKLEGEQIPREVSEATWLETKPKLEFTYATQNALDIVLGMNGYSIQRRVVEKESAFFTAKDDFEPAVVSYAHLAVVKHSGNFDGGFYYKTAAEKKRNVTKSTSIDASNFIVEDRVYDPSTVAIFMQSRQPFGQLFGEFAAVEASGGGNRTDRGGTVKEDYFRVQMAGLFPLKGKDIQLESTLIYKSLAYADNRNVTLDTIPMMGLQMKLYVNVGVPIFAGIIGVRGSDGQSIPEFNAEYKLFGIGAVTGIQTNF